MISKKHFYHFFICTLLSIFCLQLSTAQYNDLIDNPDIVWIAEFSTDHKLSIDANPNEEVIQLIKYYNDKALFENVNKDNWVIDWIINNALQNQSSCYSDPGLTQELSKERLEILAASNDTIVIFNADTYEEQIKVIKNTISASKIKSIRANQVIYYNQKTENFETRLIAVAPLRSRKRMNPVPLFWIKMNESIPSNFDLHSTDISWGALAYSVKHPLELNFMQEVKNKNSFNFLDKIYQQAINQEKAIYSPSDYSNQKLLSKEEILLVYNSIDTVTTYDPETYQAEVKIYNNSFSPDELSNFRLIQEWYYDQKKRKLMNRLVAIAPLLRVHDENENYRYTTPLYLINYRQSAQ